MARGGVMKDDDACDKWRNVVIGPAFNLILTIDRSTGSSGFQAVQEKAKS